jgi:hypothetical protein
MKRAFASPRQFFTNLYQGSTAAVSDTPNKGKIVSSAPPRVPRPRLSVFWRDRAGFLTMLEGLS